MPAARLGNWAFLAIAACIVLTACASSSPEAATSTASARPIVLDPSRWIAYGHCDQCGGSDDQVWLVHADGTSGHVITTGLDWAYQPDFSRDGESLAYEGGTWGRRPVTSPARMESPSSTSPAVASRR